jgi:hypothetical protein
MFDYLFHVPLPLPERPAPRLWKMTLIDGRNGRPLHLGGEVFAAYTRDPARTEADLMRGRDPLVWACRTEPVELPL